MKKITLVLAFAFIGLISMSSCKKDYTCECVTTDLEDNTSTTSKSTITGKKKDAEEACDKMDYNDPTFLGMKNECSIK